MKKFILLFFILVSMSAFSQVAVSGGSYFQNFGTANITSWTNNTTFPGWYSTHSLQSHIDITTAAPANTGGFYSYECSSNNDQKIGSRASGSASLIKYGVVLQNMTGASVSNVKVSYKGYQLSLAQNGATNTIGFDYIVSATPPLIGAAAGVNVPSLNFTQIQGNASSGSSQVLGYPCTKMIQISGCISVNIPANSYIMLRWTDTDDAGNDHHMAIDDVDIEFLNTNITVNSQAICSTQTATLSVNGASSYTWAPNLNISSTTGSVVTVNPPATTIYTITGSVGSCPVKTITSTVTVNPNATVTVNSATICPSGTATLTASGSANYTWAPNLTISSTTGSVVTVNPSSTIIYTVSATNGSCPPSSATATITINASPPVTVNSVSICPSGSAILTANGAGAYSWLPNLNISSTTGSVVTVNPSSTTIYTVSGTTGTCPPATAFASVTIIAGPVITAASASVCAGSQVNLTAHGLNSYTWSPAASLSATTGSLVIASPSVTTVYTIQGTNGSCIASPVTLTVTTLASPTISVNSVTLCSLGSTTLQATGANFFTWSPMSYISASSGNSVTVNPPGSTTYTVTGTNTANTCTSSAVSTITVIPSQSAAFSYALRQYCRSDAGSPMPSVTGTPGGVFTSAPVGLSISSVTGLINIPLSEPNTYTVNYSNTGICADSKNFTLSIDASPSVSINAQTLCEGDDGSLTAIPSIQGGTFLWLPLNRTTSQISIAPVATSTYAVIYSLGSCSANITTTVVVNPKPAASITEMPVPGSDALTLLASPADNYLWNNGSLTNSITIKPLETTEYCVTVTNTTGCTNNACITINVEKASTLYIPDAFTPNNDGLNDWFYTPNSNITEFSILIFDRWGTIVFKSNDIETAWDGKYKGAAAEEGVYVYKIDAAGYDKAFYLKTGHVTLVR